MSGIYVVTVNDVFVTKYVVCTTLPSSSLIRCFRAWKDTLAPGGTRMSYLFAYPASVYSIFTHGSDYSHPFHRRRSR